MLPFSRFFHAAMTLACYSVGMEDGYMAFLLRLWQVGHGEGAVWRASLEDAHTGERRALASLERLVAFLEDIPRGQADSKAEAVRAGRANPEVLAQAAVPNAAWPSSLGQETCALTLERRR
jgi:hypothetical protein